MPNGKLPDDERLRLIEDLLAENAHLQLALDEIRPVAREMHSIAGKYTRLYGSNGDRVADLLTDDAMGAGARLLAILDRAQGKEPVNRKLDRTTIPGTGWNKS